MPTSSLDRYSSPRTLRLIERIRGLVAEHQRLEQAGARDLEHALELEIERLQAQLAHMVQSELSRDEDAPGYS